MSNDYIPKPDETFHEWQSLLLSVIAAHATDWGITLSVLAPVNSLRNEWVEHWTLASHPSTRTSVTILAKTETRKSYEAALRGLVRSYLINNPAVTDADRVSMGLPVHDRKPSPVPTPATVPEFEVKMPVPRRLEIHFRDTGSTRRAKPPGVHGVEIRWALLKESPASLDELTRSGFDTRSPYTLDFDENHRGQSVYLALRWENSRGEKGPWSDIARAIIP